MQPGSPILGVGPVGLQFLDREGEGFVLGFGGGLAASCAPSAPARAAPPAGRAGPQPADRLDPRAGAATWRACAATGRVSLGGAAAAPGEVASPRPAPSRAESRGARTRQRGEIETPGRAGDTGSGSGTGGRTWLPRNPEGAPCRGGQRATHRRSFRRSFPLPRSESSSGARLPWAHGAGVGRDQNLPPGAPESGQPRGYSRPSACGGSSRAPAFSGGRLEEGGGGGRGRRDVGMEGQWEAGR